MKPEVNKIIVEARQSYDTAFRAHEQLLLRFGYTDPLMQQETVLGSILTLMTARVAESHKVKELVPPESSRFDEKFDERLEADSLQLERMRKGDQTAYQEFIQNQVAIITDILDHHYIRSQDEVEYDLQLIGAYKLLLSKLR